MVNDEIQCEIITKVVYDGNVIENSNISSTGYLLELSIESQNGVFYLSMYFIIHVSKNKYYICINTNQNLRLKQVQKNGAE